MSIAEKFVTMEYGPALEDPKEALTWLDRYERRFGHFINGTLQPPAEDSYFETADPSTGDRKSTRLNSSHVSISYAVFCLKKKKFINTIISHYPLTTSL